VSTILEVTYGNEGALTVIGKLAQLNPEPQVFRSWLENLTISCLRGSQIWIAYKDYCNEDIGLFQSLLVKQDVHMITFAMKESF
jgi:hypothetical protein